MDDDNTKDDDELDDDNVCSISEVDDKMEDDTIVDVGDEVELLGLELVVEAAIKDEGIVIAINDSQ